MSSQEHKDALARVIDPMSWDLAEDPRWSKEQDDVRKNSSRLLDVWLTESMTRALWPPLNGIGENTETPKSTSLNAQVKLVNVILSKMV